MDSRIDSLPPGKRFRFRSEVLAIESPAAGIRPVVLPRNSVVRLTMYPCCDDGRLVEVIWEDHSARLFGLDILLRADLIEAQEIQPHAQPTPMPEPAIHIKITLPVRPITPDRPTLELQR